MLNAKYVYPDHPTFEAVVKTIQNTPLAAGDVNGLWCSAILPVYFPYRDTTQYALKPDFAYNAATYDILVTKQVTDDSLTPSTQWTPILIFQGKGPYEEGWDVLLNQIRSYFEDSNQDKLYAIGAIGRECKFWEWSSTHPGAVHQLIIDYETDDITTANTTRDSFDVSTQSIWVEKCIQFVIDNTA